jgi:hypothetical protein
MHQEMERRHRLIRSKAAALWVFKRQHRILGTEGPPSKQRLFRPSLTKDPAKKEMKDPARKERSSGSASDHAKWRKQSEATFADVVEALHACSAICKW